MSEGIIIGLVADSKNISNMIRIENKISCAHTIKEDMKHYGSVLVCGSPTYHSIPWQEKIDKKMLVITSKDYDNKH